MSVSVEPRRPTPKREDFAVLIGVSRYVNFPATHGVQDAVKFAEWLAAPEGGALPPENIRLVVSDEPATEWEKTAFPNLNDVLVAFESLVKSMSTTPSRVARRLYIYVAGHGYLFQTDDVCLLMADATDKYGSVSVTQHANFFRNSGAFEEVILFADCDRVPESGPEPAPLSLPPLKVENPHETSSFYAFAAEFGQKAFEGYASTSRGQELVHGYFTHALVEGLHGAAAAPDGRVTADTLQNFLLHRLAELSVGRQQPYFTRTGNRPVVFVEPALEAEAEKPAAKERVERPARAKGVEPSKRPEPRLPGHERVATQQDDPATVDELERRPFAEVIAARIEEVWKAQPAPGGGRAPGAFMVHIHGPWGSGKTSVLNFLRAHLQDETRAQRWVVIDYNAWRNQRIRPPWWTLIKEIYTQSARQLGFFRSPLLRVRWLMWRARADLLPALAAVGFVLLAVLLATGYIGFRSGAREMMTAAIAGPTQAPLATAGQTAAGAVTGTAAPASGSDKVAEAIELGLKIIAAAGAAGAAVFALSRSLLFGSARAAQTYSELRSDPLGPVVRLFQKLVKAIHRPVLVLIDDMDRCDSSHVVELLEGIQTLFRSAPVTYVVAADRKWICSSFEKGFADFGKTIGEPGRPLGYLFLDKVFQVSASIPRLPPEVRYRYLSGLLRNRLSVTPEKLEERRKLYEEDAQKAVTRALTQEELDVKIADAHRKAQAQGNPLLEQAMRAAAAKQITSVEARLETEHMLQGFARMLEPNPRSMKRLVNAFGLNQATQFLEGRSVRPELLARWTVIELRWPLLADLLAERPELVTDLAEGKTPTDVSVPVHLKKLFGDAVVKDVVAGHVARGGPAALDEEAVKRIVGLTSYGAQPDAAALATEAAGAPAEGGAANNTEE